MTRQVIPFTLEPGAYPDPDVSPLGAGIAFLQENVSSHSAFPQIGREVLVAWNKAAGTNDQQTIETDTPTPASGFAIVTLVIQGITYVSPHIAWNAIATATQAALLAAVDSDGTLLSKRFPAGLTVAGSALPATQTITFSGPLAGQLLDVITIDSSGVGGGTFKSVHGVSGAGQHVVTVWSANDPFNRTADIVQTVGGGVLYTFPYFKQVGWRQADGNIWVDGDSTSLWFGVIQTPSQ